LQIGSGVEPPTTSAVARTADTHPRRHRRFLALDDFEAAARRRLPRPIFGYVSGTVERGQSLRDNQAAFAEIGFRPRMLVDVSGRSPAASLFGPNYTAPFGIAPMGGSLLAAHDADVVLARAAADAGIPFILSASSLTPLERVAAAGARWFQAYLPGDPDRISPMIDRVARAGFETLVLTVDVPILGNRENNRRTGFSMPLQPSARLAWDFASHPRWLAQWLRTLLRNGIPHFENMEAGRGPPVISRHLERNMARRDGLAWAHVELIRRRWPGKLVLKGILRSDDAVRAREAGVDGLILSNHGGRQLDGAIAPLRVLPEIAAEKGPMAIMLDGSIRRGTDVLKALALGADFVFVGRPLLYAAAVGGEAAVRHAVALLTAEIDRDMALIGAATLAEVTRSLLAEPAGANRPQLPWSSDDQR
jgi:L-lactate dehydrogenase (cytochrome)